MLIADLSFISLTLVQPAPAPLPASDGALVCLVKPQFEVGPAKVGRRGIGRACGLACLGRIVSPIEGGEGNVEFLLWLKHHAGSDRRGGE